MTTVAMFTATLARSVGGFPNEAGRSRDVDDQHLVVLTHHQRTVGGTKRSFADLQGPRPSEACRLAVIDTRSSRRRSRAPAPSARSGPRPRSRRCTTGHVESRPTSASTPEPRPDRRPTAMSPCASAAHTIDAVADGVGPATSKVALGDDDPPDPLHAPRSNETRISGVDAAEHKFPGTSTATTGRPG